MRKLNSACRCPCERVCVFLHLFEYDSTYIEFRIVTHVKYLGASVAVR